MKNVIKRDAETVLPLSIKFAKEYFNALCKLQENIGAVQESRELTTTYRALWTALIMEVGRLFDTYETKGVISFKKLPHLRESINKYHSENIIGKIIETRNTFTGHFAKDARVVIVGSEICESNLGEILDEMSELKI